MLLTKQATAQRLIQAAILQSIEKADPLAVYATASCALSLLRELSLKLGDNHSTRMFCAYLYRAGKYQAQGGEHMYPLPDYPDVKGIVAEIADGIRNGTINGPKDVGVEIPLLEDRAIFHHIVKPFNFIKHASRDHDALLDETSLDTTKVIMHSISVYIFLFQENVTDEMLAFVEDNCPPSATII